MLKQPGYEMEASYGGYSLALYLRRPQQARRAFHLVARMFTFGHLRRALKQPGYEMEASYGG